MACETLTARRLQSRVDHAGIDGASPWTVGKKSVSDQIILGLDVPVITAGTVCMDDGWFKSVEGDGGG